MAKYAKVSGGVVINVVETDADPGAPYVAIPVGVKVNKGYVWDGSTFSEAPVSLPEAKKLARLRLQNEYTRRRTMGNFTGLSVMAIREDILLAELLFQKGGTSYPAVADGQAVLLNQAKVNQALTYFNDCAVNAQAHFTTLQGLSSLAEVKTFVTVTIKSGWPAEDL